MMYADNPRRSAPSAWQWFSVETPSVFREYKLPVDDRHMSRAHKRQYAELQRLAAEHGVSIRASDYRRG